MYFKIISSFVIVIIVIVLLGGMLFNFGLIFPNASKANTERKQLNVMEEQFEHEARQTEALESIAESLKLLTK